MISKQFLQHVELIRDEAPDFDAYPFSLPAVRGLSRLDLHPAVTFLVGENGTGKSTLLEGIAVAWGFNPEGGSSQFNFSTRSSHSPLCDYLELGRCLPVLKDICPNGVRPALNTPQREGSTCYGLLLF